MKIRYVTGNLLDAPEQILIHSCNAQGAMNSGVAKDIRDRHPNVYKDYRRAYDTDGVLSLGDVIWSDCGRYFIGSAITQEYYGRELGVRYCSYEAIARALERVNDVARSSNVEAVAMPLISAGLAQGSWRIISTIIETESKNFEPVVYLMDGVIPTT